LKLWASSSHSFFFTWASKEKLLTEALLTMAWREEAGGLVKGLSAPLPPGEYFIDASDLILANLYAVRQLGILPNRHAWLWAA